MSFFGQCYSSVIKVSKPRSLTSANVNVGEVSLLHYSPDLLLPTSKEMQAELESFPTMTLRFDQQDDFTKGSKII